MRLWFGEGNYAFLEEGFECIDGCLQKHEPGLIGLIRGPLGNGTRRYSGVQAPLGRLIRNIGASRRLSTGQDQ